MTSHPVQASSIKKNSYMVINGFPCRVIENTFSRPGKHGHGKIHFVGIDIFTNKKYEAVGIPASHNMEVPDVHKVEYQLLDINEGFLSLMDDNGEIKEDARLPDEELGEKIQNLFDHNSELTVCIQSAMNQEAVISFKENK